MLAQTLESDKMKDFGFTLKPRYYPYLINESLDEKPVTKAELYEAKFMGAGAMGFARARMLPLA